MFTKPIRFQQTELAKYIQRRSSYLMVLAIIVGVLIVRMPGLRDPLSGPHDIRMNETAAIARNFYENSTSIFYPQVDWGGSGPGFVQDGFQIYAYLVSIAYRIVGVSDTVGRLLSVVFFGAAAAVFYFLVRQLAEQPTAIFATLFFSIAPMGIYYGRSFQPESLMLLFSISAVYFFLRWTETESRHAFLGSAVAVAVAIMMKPTNLYLGVPILYLSWRRFGNGLVRKRFLWLYAGVALIPGALWYWHAHHLWLLYGNTNISNWNLPWSAYSTSLVTSPQFYWEMASRIARTLTTTLGLPLLLLGLLLKQPRGIFLAQVWIGGFVIIAIITAGSQYPHDYYQLPLIAPLSLLLGSAVGYLWQTDIESALVPSGVAAKLFASGVCLLVAASAWQSMRRHYRLPDEPNAQLSLAHRLSEVTDQGSLIITSIGHSRGPGPATSKCCNHRELNGRYFGHHPVIFHQSDRNGWSIHVEDWTLEVVRSLQTKGARYFAALVGQISAQKSEFLEAMADEYQLIERTSEWVIFRLGTDLPPNATTHRHVHSL